MADLTTQTGKFTNSTFTQENYDETFTGATKIAGKLKRGGTNTDGTGFVADAVDLDWGGLELTEVYNEATETTTTNDDNSTTTTTTYELKTKTITTNAQHTSDNQNDGIVSTGALLNSISKSLSILATRTQDALNGLDDAVGGNLSGLESEIDTAQGDISYLSKQVKYIKDELSYTGSTELATIIDNLRTELGGDDKTLTKFVDDKIESLEHTTVKYESDDDTSSTDGTLVITNKTSAT